MTGGTSTEAYLRLTVATLLRATADSQAVLATALGISQGQVSRRLSGRASWTLADLDALSSHYGIPVPDLLCGPTHALQKLPARRQAAMIGGRQQMFHVVPA
ncbi:helix-turn-helix domain-containing protein [Kitasatospora sp. NPDC059646]|uniref:helix-turn-helix domain-containing protein n=1 Tax=Kitasatospora sp. NPDC059646 TaxID=3346893 RepID=UPI00367E24A5